jgi:hypothetical protein
MNRLQRKSVLTLACCAALLGTPRAHAVTLQWIRQVGTPSTDVGIAVSADSLGSVYISGYTTGSLGGSNAGGWDAFVSKYDATGAFQWTRQLGTSADDYSRAVSADGLGNVYISGHTSGSLGGAHAGSEDAFIGKYDAAGNLQWIRQLGDISRDWGYGVSADGLGNVYISGSTDGSLAGMNAGQDDAFVSKYDAAQATSTSPVSPAASWVHRAPEALTHMSGSTTLPAT